MNYLNVKTLKEKLSFSHVENGKFTVQVKFRRKTYTTESTNTSALKKIGDKSRQFIGAYRTEKQALIDLYCEAVESNNLR